MALQMREELDDSGLLNDLKVRGASATPQPSAHQRRSSRCNRPLPAAAVSRLKLSLRRGSRLNTEFPTSCFVRLLIELAR